jgi:hypothetical protein
MNRSLGVSVVRYDEVVCAEVELLLICTLRLILDQHITIIIRSLTFLPLGIRVFEHPPTTPLDLFSR